MGTGISAWIIILEKTNPNLMLITLKINKENIKTLYHGSIVLEDIVIVVLLLLLDRDKKIRSEYVNVRRTLKYIIITRDIPKKECWESSRIRSFE